MSAKPFAEKELSQSHLDEDVLSKLSHLNKETFEEIASFETNEDDDEDKGMNDDDEEVENERSEDDKMDSMESDNDSQVKISKINHKEKDERIPDAEGSKRENIELHLLNVAASQGKVSVTYCDVAAFKFAGKSLSIF